MDQKLLVSLALPPGSSMVTDTKGRERACNVLPATKTEVTSGPHTAGLLTKDAEDDKISSDPELEAG